MQIYNFDRVILKAICKFGNLGADERIILKLVPCVERVGQFEVDLSHTEDSGVLGVVNMVMYKHGLQNSVNFLVAERL